MSGSLQPYGLSPTRLLCSWDFSGKNTRVGCHFLLQGIFPSGGSKPCLLHWLADSLPPRHWESHLYIYPLPSGFPSRLGHRRALSRVPCAILWVLSVIYSTHSSVICQPPCLSSSHPSLFPAGSTHLLFLCLCFCFANRSICTIFFLDSTYMR